MSNGFCCGQQLRAGPMVSKQDKPLRHMSLSELRYHVIFCRSQFDPFVMLQCVKVTSLIYQCGKKFAFLENFLFHFT